MNNKSLNNPPRVGIIGGGYGGLTAAIHLAASKFHVSLFDHKKKFDWLPNIHELISGMKRESDLQFCLERRLSELGHTFCNEFVTFIDPEHKKVVTDQGKAYQFDFIIVSVGGVNNTFGVKDADKYTLPFKSVENCACIRDRLREVVRNTENPKVGIIGGGLEGIEVLGEILRAYNSSHDISLTLVANSPRLLAIGPGAVSNRLQHYCKIYGIDLRLKRKVTDVYPEGIVLDEKESLDLDVIIWTGGGTAPPLLYDSGLAEDEKSWVMVNEYLESTDFKNIFIIGDAAYLPEPVDKQAYHALDMGKLAAENIIRVTNDLPTLPFKPTIKPFLLTFGDIDTFMIFGEKVISGPTMSIAKELVYQMIMRQLEGTGHLHAIEDTLKRLPSLLRVLTRNRIIRRVLSSLLNNTR
ncbi:MAG: FAD-dependent oxidoreductase [Candidatus Scalindua rubra]|uniref:Pyridine nucleotide-disulfide oxidoreductase n=1 Tax=Candidatus Scalindua brodae TaxID=237368 RepID=A0A0B0EBP7_9BACT|nr:MAG: pyridine nucleotide-disulfide oxidoreductase [Candidatus Scalindua brodae]MBZ0108551.1 FAD-dependent oxidoreductase [Candidatus Scalindua rubra]